jgi:hypothetical protein
MTSTKVEGIHRQINSSIYALVTAYFYSGMPANRQLLCSRTAKCYCMGLIGGPIYVQQIFLVEPIYLPDNAIAIENCVIQNPSTVTQIKITHIPMQTT